MSQQSGFFESVWDESIVNPQTGTLGDWDIKYYYNQFAEYFAKFFGNGVYYNPDNNLKVLSTGAMSVAVKAGWAFINGFWFHLDEDISLPVPNNSTAFSRTDSVIVRWNLSNRVITLMYAADTVEPVRSDSIYDLILAQVVVEPSVVNILGDKITDKRTDQSVCGIVRGLEADTIDTETLFAQYDAIFNEWFDTVKDQVTGDLAIRLQTEFVELNENVEEYYENTTQAVDNYQTNTEAQIAQYQQSTQQQIAGYNSNYQQTLNNSNQLIAEYVDKDYVIQEQTINFSNNKWRYTDAKITVGTLVDVYFTSGCYKQASDAVIVVDSYAGYFELTCETTPNVPLYAMFRVRVR